METRVIPIEEENIKEDVLKEAGEIIKRGGLVAFPTETVYGLGGNALDETASEKIYRAKGRPSDNPLIVHICRMEDIYPIVKEVPEAALKLADVFWPGPLTMILKKSDKVPDTTTGGLDTVAVRMPGHKTALAFIAAAGGYVAAPSANRSGRPSPTLARYVAQDLSGRIEMIIDGGDVELGLESTIVDLTAGTPVILRPGYITRAMLEDTLGQVEEDITILRDDSGQAPKAPGMKYRHYAPKGELTIISGPERVVTDYINARLDRCRAENKKTGVIASDATAFAYRADVCKNGGSRLDESALARRLYRILREFDDEDVEIIYAESFEGAGVGQAVMNRLLKAAGHRVIELK